MVEIQSREASRDYVGIFGMFGIFGNRQWNSADTQGAATPGQREKETVGLFYCRLTTGSFSRKPGSSHWSMIHKLYSGTVRISTDYSGFVSDVFYSTRDSYSRGDHSTPQAALRVPQTVACTLPSTALQRVACGPGIRWASGSCRAGSLRPSVFQNRIATRFRGSPNLTYGSSPEQCGRVQPRPR